MIPKCQLAVIKIHCSVLTVFNVDGDIQLIIALCPDNCWQMSATTQTDYTVHECSISCSSNHT